MANRLSDIDWFQWNGIKCTDYGMHVLTQPSIVRPSEKTSSEEIPGRSGTLTLLEGDDIYDDISMYCICIIDDCYESVDGENVSRIAKINGWLRGSGKIVFANRQEGYYIGRISNQISFEQIVKGNPHRSFSVQFQCEPFFYLNSGLDAISAGESPILITNKGNIPSAPLIRLTGSSEGAIMIGDQTMLINSFEGIDYILLDCEAKIAYKGTRSDPSDPLILLGTRVTGEWLTIPTDASYVTLTGGITSAEIIPRWRCI